MKRSLKVLLTTLGVISAIGIILSCISYSYRNISVSVIGGADGPTSIFLAGKIGDKIILYIITGLSLTAIIIFSILLFKKKK